MDADIINSVAAVITALAVLGAVVQGWFIRKAVEDVSRHTNSMKDELVAEVRTASFAKGQLSRGEVSNTESTAARQEVVPEEKDLDAKG